MLDEAGDVLAEDKVDDAEGYERSFWIDAQVPYRTRNGDAFTVGEPAAHSDWVMRPHRGARAQRAIDRGE